MDVIVEQPFKFFIIFDVVPLCLYWISYCILLLLLVLSYQITNINAYLVSNDFLFLIVIAYFLRHMGAFWGD